MKVNCDGAFSSSTFKASCGGIIKNSLGWHVEFFSCVLGSCAPWCMHGTYLNDFVERINKYVG